MAIYRNMESLCCKLEINMISYVIPQFRKYSHSHCLKHSNVKSNNKWKQFK